MLAGLAGIDRPKHNRRYSLVTKLNAVREYQSHQVKAQKILERHHIRSLSQLQQWNFQYNQGKLSVTHVTRKRARRMGRKVSFEEKKRIVQWVLEHGHNYQAAANKYQVSYARVYNWVRKYSKNNDWQSLQDKRGRNKGKEPTTELERLRKRVRELEKKERERQVQIDFAKKLVEIRNREVKRPDDIKRFKK